MNAVNHVSRPSAFDSIMISQSKKHPGSILFSGYVTDTVPTATLIQRDQSKLSFDPTHLPRASRNVTGGSIPNGLLALGYLSVMRPF